MKKVCVAAQPANPGNQQRFPFFDKLLPFGYHLERKENIFMSRFTVVFLGLAIVMAVTAGCGGDTVTPANGVDSKW